jgi:hypothetical protein
MQKSKHPDRPFQLLPLCKSVRLIDRAVQILYERHEQVEELSQTIAPSASVFLRVGEPAVAALCRHVHLCKGAAPCMGKLDCPRTTSG